MGDSSPPNTDLEALAVVVAQCMDGKVFETDGSRDVAKRMRAQKRQVFGIQDAERWSGSKQLIDFLDEMLGTKLPDVKLNLPVSQCKRPSSPRFPDATVYSTLSLRNRSTRGFWDHSAN